MAASCHIHEIWTFRGREAGNLESGENEKLEDRWLAVAASENI